MVLLGILLIAAGILILALGRFPHATTIGLIVAVAGVVVILAAVLDTSDTAAAAVIAWPLPGRLGRLRGRYYSWRHDVDRRLEMLCLSIARRLPRRLRMWVVVDSTNTAREMYPDPTGYAGPDGLTYAHIYDGARRERTPGRDEPMFPMPKMDLDLKHGI